MRWVRPAGSIKQQSQEERGLKAPEPNLDFLKIRALLLWVGYLNESLSRHRSAANKTDTSQYWKERILPLLAEE